MYFFPYLLFLSIYLPVYLCLSIPLCYHLLWSSSSIFYVFNSCLRRMDITNFNSKDSHDSHTIPFTIYNPVRPDDVDKSRVHYKLTGQSPDMQDSFVFDLMDSRPNILPDNVFHVKWSEISLGLPVFNVSETQGVLFVPVLRKGNLKQVQRKSVNIYNYDLE